MKDQTSVSSEGKTRYKRHLSPLGVWALSFGCSVGWGAFVMPGSTFLPIAGPVGTALGIFVGAVVMFLLGMSYHYLLVKYPDSGGTFTFAGKVFGYDHGFLFSWFMALVYLAIIWANSTALPLIFRGLFGDLLEFGYLYTVAGYEVYTGEIILSVLSIVLFGLVALRGGKLTSAVQITLALILIAGVTVGFASVFLNGDSGAKVDFTPAFSPDHSPAAGVLFIVFLTPWAFAGFESVSHSVEEFRFPVKKTLKILGISIATSALAYVFLNFIAASSQPEEYDSWYSYVKALGDPSLDGIRGLPVFNGISAALGVPGLIILGVAAAAGIITGLIGNTVAASRLVGAMSRDGVIPENVGKLNKRGVPSKVILFLMLISLPIPFLGRSAIGWVVDINSIGVTIAYAYTSAAALKEALREKNRKMTVVGGAGLVVSLLFLVYFLFPNKWSVSGLATESYLMLLVWILAGFAVYYIIFRRDKLRRFGRSTAVWMILLLLLFSTSFIWMRQKADSSADAASASITQMMETEFSEKGIALSGEDRAQIDDSVSSNVGKVTGEVIRTTVFLFIIITASLLSIFNIYRIVSRRHLTAVNDKNIAEQSSVAKTTFLSNMSHDIRTPMNAIIGYVTLAKREKGVTPKVSEYLSKIEASSDHLLALINDVLEMSRIESGKMELAPVPSDMFEIMNDVKNLFTTQMETKGLTYNVVYDEVKDNRVLCDANRLNRVLLNLVSNAYKFTPKGGEVRVTLKQTGKEDGKAMFRLSVKDTGIGMSPEFAAKVFEAYERERTATVENIQGTGLGTAITKSIVDLMGGNIEVFTEQGKGSEFVIDVAFPIDPEAAASEKTSDGKERKDSVFAGMRLLLAEDNKDNSEVAKTLLEDMGFAVDVAENGEDALEMIASSEVGEYSAVIMDIEMPVKSGHDAAKAIRGLKNKELALIPIVALSAKAFSEDIAASRDAGMNAHIAKPFNTEKVYSVLYDLLIK